MWKTIQKSKEQLNILSLKERIEMKYCKEKSQKVYEIKFKDHIAKLKNIDKLIDINQVRSKCEKEAFDMYFNYCGRIKYEIREKYIKFI